MCVIGSFMALVLAGATEPPAATESADALKHFQQAGKYSKQQQGEAGTRAGEARERQRDREARLRRRWRG